MKAYRSLVALGMPLLMLQACASYRPSAEVTAQMARTDAVIQQADRSGVAVNSLPELQAAKDKYAQAKVAMERKSSDGDQAALKLAKQAEVDAQYASAKAQSTTQKDAAHEAQSGVEDLRQEANRNTTPPTAAPVTAAP